MPALRLFDTAKGGIVTLEATGEQSMYVCGITPYDATHMGHAASYVAFDLLNRAWRDGRQQVAYVQNVTDVDDPLLERATATGVDWRELAASQIELFQTDMEALNVLAPDHYIGAVEAVPLIVPAIERLLHNGLAYRVPGTGGEPDGDVYYDVEAAGKHSTDLRTPSTPGPWDPFPDSPTPKCWNSSPNAAATRAGPGSARRSIRCSGGLPARASPAGPAASWGRDGPAGTSNAP